MGDQVYRKRMKRLEVEQGLRFVTFSCEKRLPLFLNPAIADVFVQSMSAARAKWGFRLIAWVVMPEHVHMIVRPKEGHDLALILMGLKVSVSKRVVTRWIELQAPILEKLVDEHGCVRFWKRGGGFDRNVRDLEELCREIRYVHRNPIERGLVAQAQDWKWSSIRWWMGQRDGEPAGDWPDEDVNVWERWQEYV
jgi:putative transposase